eukprot:c10486_g1_i1.p1 GENE.c10486_g1_i1~~c10486_g1_i1.p1  ORF type:complete len:219 (+),score=64.54 c10486_g1_i1:28-657(+)
MAKEKKLANVVTPASSQQPEKEVEEDKDDEKIIKGNTGDWNYVKTTVDAAILKYLEDGSYPLDKSLMNLKLVLGYVAVGFGLLAQFYPKPWPETWHLTLFCVIMYAILSSTMQLMVWYYDMDASAITKPLKNEKYGFIVNTRYERFTDFIEIVFTSKDPSKQDKKYEFSKGSSIGKWFDSEGVFYPKQFNGFFKKALDEYSNFISKRSN